MFFYFLGGIMTNITFDEIRIWQPSEEPVMPDLLLPAVYLPEEKEILDSAYGYTQSFYADLPLRKNGEKAFVHPTWAARFTAMAGGQFETILTALSHDIIEEHIDKHIEENKTSDPEAIKIVERAMRHELEKFFYKEDFSKMHSRIKISLQLVWLLTRLKRDNYYGSLLGIFLHPNPMMRIMAATTKLADRLHNINCLDCFPDPSDKLYQCYKNLFVLNNAKNLLIESSLEQPAVDSEILKPLAKLIKKCGKGSYQAVDLFLAESKRSLSNPEIYLYLSLALRKYILEEKGIWQVTKQKLSDSSHPSSLFDGILLKYHNKLRRQIDQFSIMNETEKDFIRNFYEELNLPEKEYNTIIYLKDAMALREVFASLMYLPDYTITGFCLSKERGRVKKEELLPGFFEEE